MIFFELSKREFFVKIAREEGEKKNEKAVR